MSLSTIQKVYKSGKDSLSIHIPKNIAQILKIENGDIITIDWGEVIKKADNEENENEEEEEEGLPNL